jgi:hypothetical protein
MGETVTDLKIREMRPPDKSEVSELICVSTNQWYLTHGSSLAFPGGPRVTEIFFDVYSALDGTTGIVAENIKTGRLMGSCFYHIRPTHVSLGIMNVHPNYFNLGVARKLLTYITDISDREKKPLRLVSSAMNLDSFSLYNQAGFIPRSIYQDILMTVPENGIKQDIPGLKNVRPATLDDVPGMKSLELEVSSIQRGGDYAFFIENRDGLWHASVWEGINGKINGYLVSCPGHGFNMLGPGVARDQDQLSALILNDVNQYKGKTILFIIPAECSRLVKSVYEWGGKNNELHFCQVRGDFTPFNGVTVPTFMPETG